MEFRSFCFVRSKTFSFDVFLGVIPSTTSVSHVDCKHKSGSDSSNKHSSESFSSKEETVNERRAEGKSSGNKHFPQRSSRGDVDAFLVVWSPNGSRLFSKKIL